MEKKIKWFDVIFLIIFIMSFLCLISIGVRVVFSYVILTYVGVFYVIGVSIVMILSGDYLIDKILEWKNNDD